MVATVRVLCVGDVVGRPGRDVCKGVLKKLRAERRLDSIVVNGENSSGGLGIDPGCAEELRESGADIITLGDHTWQRKEARDFLERNSDWCIRPANYPAGAPGRGWAIHKLPGGVSCGVMNLMGRVFINIPLDCPFRKGDELLSNELKNCSVRICDMHAEATSEKVAMGRYLDGRISLQFGTHTHVQTADEQVLPGGTGFITDVGMTGSADGVIGMDAGIALKRFLTGMPHAYQIAAGAGLLCGLVSEVDIGTGRILSVERVRVMAES